tara:strand:- start:8 stop:463 length:456 start_codon:yes stop_codon:yes gene_type:complete
MAGKKREKRKQQTERVDLYQAAALPFRVRKGKLEFCLVTVRGGQSWTMPKGTIEKSELGTDCAGRESFEEAGLEGRVLEPALCRYTDSKGKKTIEVTVWLFEVSRCLKKWPEKKSRTRQWASPRKAIRLLERPKLVAPVIDGIRRLERWDD